MKQALSLSLIITLILSAGYILSEPQITKAVTGQTQVTLSVTGEINISCSSTVALSPSIAGQTGGTATTSFNCTVETNDSSGYNLTLQKNQKLRIADAVDQRFDDYTTSTATSTPDWTWDTVASGAEEFGFAVNSSASTTDVVQLFRDNGSSACNTGTSVTVWRCWSVLPTSATIQVLNRSTATPAGGILTTFGLEAQAGGSNNLQEGTYYSTTTATAVVNS